MRKSLHGKDGSGRGRWIGFGAGLGIVMLASLPPFVGEAFGSVLMSAFASVCHQLPDRSPHVAGTALAVCFRCYGIYWGIPLAAVVYPMLHARLERLDRWAPLVLVASLVPAAIDWLLEALGLVQGSQGVRFLTGLLFGLVAGYYLVSAIDRPRTARAATAL